jgi:hypothetical protein
MSQQPREEMTAHVVGHQLGVPALIIREYDRHERCQVVGVCFGVGVVDPFFELAAWVLCAWFVETGRDVVDPLGDAVDHMDPILYFAVVITVKVTVTVNKIVFGAKVFHFWNNVVM